MAEYNKERRWTAPNKCAESYANERKAKVHQHGQKEGQPFFGHFTVYFIHKTVSQRKR